jgi:alkylation response protein AidB-like acyl-CoA dehydrogenase
VDFSLSQQQSILQESVRRYCRENYDLSSRQQILRSADGFSAKHWAAFAELGWLGATLPEDAGGYGGSVVEAAIILEEFGRVLVLEPYLPSAVLAAQAIWRTAEVERARTLLEPMVHGKHQLALAHTERACNGITGVIETTARKIPGGNFVLSGKKTFVLGGNRAHQFIVSARTSGGRLNDRNGISLFLVDHSASGLSRRSYRTLDGSGVADLTFNELVIPPDDLLGCEGTSLEAVQQAIDFAIVGLCAEAVGSMDKVISTTVDYLKTRRAYGTTLSTYQALQHQLADMLVELEMSRSILYRAFAAFADSDRSEWQRAASAAKALIGRAGKFVAARGIQLHGAMGMVDDYIIGQLFKRLTVLEALFGNSDLHLSRRFRQ